MTHTNRIVEKSLPVQPLNWQSESNRKTLPAASSN
jgi:hypothetical protein